MGNGTGGKRIVAAQNINGHCRGAAKANQINGMPIKTATANHRVDGDLERVATAAALTAISKAGNALDARTAEASAAATAGHL
jgi:hypothetical protein